MGDPLGSPRVAPLFVPTGSYLFNIYLIFIYLFIYLSGKTCLHPFFCPPCFIYFLFYGVGPFRWAGRVGWWVFFSPPKPGEVRRDGLNDFSAQSMAGAIIPALMHRIPSELRS